MSEPDPVGRHTVDADEATMQEMRRYAEAARQQAGEASNGEHTIDADGTEMEQIRGYAEAARADASRRPAAAAEVTLPVPDEAVARSGEIDRVPLEPVFASDEVPTVDRPRESGSVPVPPDRPGDRWQPPPRTVMPVTAQPAEPAHSPGLWKPAAIVLAVIVAVLTTILIVGANSDDEPAPGTTVPGSAVASSTPQPGPEGGITGD